MTVREQLSKELEQASESLVEEILDFCLFLKQRQQTKINNQATETKTNGILDLLERVKEIQAQVPTEEWDKLPHDGSINHDHYLYGSPKVEG
jgi:ssDNA-specific exonuclease RecJ